MPCSLSSYIDTPGVSGQEEKQSSLIPGYLILLSPLLPHVSIPEVGIRELFVHSTWQPSPWESVSTTEAASVLRIPDGCRPRFLRSVLNISPAPSPTCLSALPSHPGLSPGFTWARRLSCYCTQHEPVGPSIFTLPPEHLF